MTMSMAVPSTSFKILTVCTGNICRSPLAEHLLRQHLGRWPIVEVTSAGTRALVGKPMTAQTIGIAQANGAIDANSHSARELGLDQLRDADLVIALTRAHRGEIAATFPRGSRHTFTLRELARLFENLHATDLETVAKMAVEDTAGRVAELVDVAAGLRGFVAPPEDQLDDDVIDPYHRGDDIYALMANQLIPAVETIADSFTLAATITPHHV